ncbi:MAG: hypothetical protein ACTH8J_09760 [Specibacter sp.]
MSTGLYGADPEELRQFARELEHANTVLLAVKSQLSARISSNLRWEGPDAFVFRHAWQSSYAPVIGQAAAMLEATAHTLQAQAAEQESASS